MRFRLAASYFAVTFIAAAWAVESPQPGTNPNQSGRNQARTVASSMPGYLQTTRPPQDRGVDTLSRHVAGPSVIRDALAGQAGPGVTSASPGQQLALTAYDLQQYDAVPHQIATNGSGKHIHFVWTHLGLIPTSPSQVFRLANCNTYNSEWQYFSFGMDGVSISGAGGDGQKAQGGFVTLDLDDADSARMAFYQRDLPEQDPGSGGDYSSWEVDQVVPFLSVFAKTLLPGSKGVLGNPGDDMIGPHVTVDQIPTEPDILHIVAHTYNANSNIVYWRWKSTDTPKWKGPYAIDSCTSLSYNIAADRSSPKASLVTENNWTTGSNPNGLRQIVYRESATNGDDWGPVNTTGLGDSKRTFITSYTTGTGPQAWLEVVGDYDNSGNLHIVWVEQRTANTSHQAALMHWDKLSGRISAIQTAFYDNLGSEPGERSLHISFPSIGFGDGSTTCGGQTNLNYLYVTFVQFGGTSAAEQADMSAKGYMNGEVYLSSSNNGGISWAPATNLTNTRSPGCDPARRDSCHSDVWPSIARTVDDTLHIMYMSDRDAGYAVIAQGVWTFNPVMYYRIPGGANTSFLCPSVLAPNVTAELSDLNPSDCGYATAPGTELHETLTLNNLGNSPLTGVVSVVPAMPWLTLTGAGAYLIPPGGSELTFPVSLNATAMAESLYHADILITHNDPTKTSPLVIPVDFVVQDSLRPNFAAFPVNGLVPLTVTFETTHKGAANGLLWRFGDGTTSTLLNPVHIYTTPGGYDVQLLASLDIGECHRADSIVKPAYITASSANSAPVARDTSWTTNQDTQRIVAYLPASDPDAGQLLTFAILLGPAHGATAGFNSATGGFAYTPAAGYVGPDSLMFTVCDNGLPSMCDTGTVHITVLSVNHPPVAICRDVTITANSACQATASINDGSYDPDSGDTLSIIQVPAGPYSRGITPIQLIISDHLGAADTCQATVTVVDSTPPVIVCPSDTIVYVGSGQSGTAVLYGVGATDNCELASVNGTPPTGAFFPIGATPVTVIATDGGGNTDTCRFNVIISPESGQEFCFNAPVNHPVGSYPYSVVAADLDGDGDQDLVVANSESDNVSILKNNGNASFETAVNYAAGHGPYSVIAADLDGNGKPDVAVANRYGLNVSVLRNNGDGTFAPAVNYATGEGSESVFAADLDGDGDRDLIAANGISGNVSVLKNNGDGTFVAAVNYVAGMWPTSVFAADLSGDGKPDLAVANVNSNDVSVLGNNGDGTFAAAVSYAVGSAPYSVSAADLDGDGDRDLAVANTSSATVSVLKNNGNGTFDSAVNYVAGSMPLSVVAADLDGDHDVDLAVANQFSANVSVLGNNGDGFFTAAVNYAAGDSPYSVSAADLDGDGDQDLMVAHNNTSAEVSVIINCLDPAFTPTGSNVSKFLANGVHVTFSSVTIAGRTTSATNSSGPPPPNGFNIVPTAPPVYYDIQTTASYSPPVTVCFNYTDPSLSGPETDLRLLHYESGTWVDHTTSQDLVNNVICGSVSSLSPFILVEPCSCLHQGDINSDGVLDVFDIIGVIGVAFTGDPDPRDPSCQQTRGDVDNSGVTDVFDVIYLIATTFSGGPNPVNPCGT